MRLGAPPRRMSKKLALLLAIGIVAFLFAVRSPAKPNVDVTIPSPGKVLVGQPFVLDVSFSNLSDGVLKAAGVSVMLPDGVSFLGQSPDQRVMEVPIGDIGPGSVNNQNFNLIVTNGAESLKHIEAKLAYSAASSRAEFETATASDIIVGEPAVSFAFDVPKDVFNGNAFQVNINYANNTNQNLKHLSLKLDYPPMFTFGSASIDPLNQAKNMFDLGDLASGQAGTLTLKGSVTGPDKSFFDIHGALAADFLGEKYALNIQDASIGISATPLSLGIIAGSGDGYIAHIGDEVHYVLTYTNNSPVVMQNIMIKARFAGELYDFTTLQSDASFNSLTDTATWLAANTPDLAALPPGGSASVNLSIKLKNTFPIARVSDKNYSLKIDATIMSPSVPPGTTAPNTTAIQSAETKVGGKISIGAKALWRDAPSEILNNGPYPPKVNIPTSYTIHWIIKNYSDDVANTRVSAYLQSGTQFTGIVKSSFGPPPTYDQTTGLVTWEPGQIPATKGVIGTPAEAIFQVQLTPAVNQIGSFINLVGPVTLTAHDTFTDEDLKAEDIGIQTNLPDETTIMTNDRGVQK